MRLVASLDELARDQLTAGGAGSLERRLILIMAQSSTGIKGRWPSHTMTDAREQPKVRAMLGRLRPALLGVLLLCFWSTLGAAQQGRVQRGRVFAQTNCAMCHAVGRIGDSPLAIAPPFRTLHTRYRVDDLAEALAEGIVTGHPSMPQFQLDAAQIGDLIAYLKTLEP